jgi:hypothetical protein
VIARILPPVEGDPVIPHEIATRDLTDGMGAEWCLKQKNRKVLEEQNKE